MTDYLMLAYLAVQELATLPLPRYHKITRAEYDVRMKLAREIIHNLEKAKPETELLSPQIGETDQCL